MGVEVTRLPNGLTIATDTMPHVESVALGIWVKAGARNEAPDRHGIAHLLEHMAFKGTENRTAWQIASDIENVGGEINAATSVETTSYYARVLRNDMPLAIDILSDILTASKFDEGELEREKQVIMQEIGAAHDTPDDIVFDRFTETAYRHQPIGRAILGEPETVMSFTSDDLRQYMQEQYSADRMVVTAAGGIDHDEFVREVEKRLGSFRPHNTAPTLDLAHYVGGDFRENRELMDAQVLIGFEGRAYHVRDFYASQLLSMILGGGMSSRLFQEVREKRGFAIRSMPSIGAFPIRGCLASMPQRGATSLWNSCRSLSTNCIRQPIPSESRKWTAPVRNIAQASSCRRKAPQAVRARLRASSCSMDARWKTANCWTACPSSPRNA
ncbi:peptidase M16 domain-containing protein [Brucella vulpis]|nr:zinc protease [Brucella vulpis]CUW49108.1 peptidase M16 domain-containing protein [Brucella vulpis]